MKFREQVWLPEIANGRKQSVSDALETWDNTLLPKEVAGYVLRIATLHSKVLETFLIRFFEEASDRFDATPPPARYFAAKPHPRKTVIAERSLAPTQSQAPRNPRCLSSTCGI